MLGNLSPDFQQIWFFEHHILSWFSSSTDIYKKQLVASSIFEFSTLLRGDLLQFEAQQVGKIVVSTPHCSTIMSMSEELEKLQTVLLEQHRSPAPASASWGNLLGLYMGVSENNGTPKSSILVGFSIINHPFWGAPIFGNTYIYIYIQPKMFGIVLKNANRKTVDIHQANHFFLF